LRGLADRSVYLEGTQRQVAAGNKSDTQKGSTRYECICASVRS